jgi:glycosyltransferase involved in cell wall biosynthesis
VLGPAPDEGRRAEAAGVPGLRVEATGLPLEWQDRAGPLPCEARRTLLALERGFRPDLVHANGYREAAAGFAAPVLVGAHSCVRTWWRACRGGEPPADEWGAYERGVREGLAAAGLLVAPTQAFLEEFRGAWGRLPPAPRVVPNGLDLPPAPAIPKRPFVLAAGRLWDEAKGVAALAEAAPGLPWPVLVAGDGPSGEGVRHLGRLPPAELRALMAEAAVFAAPARYEPFGLAVLEAAASGCALVLGDVPTLRELWDGTARFASRNEPGDTARGSTPGPDRGRGGAGAARGGGAERARAFTRGRMVEGYLAAYADLLARAPGEGARREGPSCSATRSSPAEHGNAHFLRGVARELAPAATRSGRSSPRPAGAARTSSATTARPGSSAGGGPTPASRPRPTRAPPPTSARRSTAPTSSSSTSGTNPGWSPPSAARAPRAGGSPSCSTTPTTGWSPTPRRCAASTSTATTGCSPSARSCASAT